MVHTDIWGIQDVMDDGGGDPVEGQDSLSRGRCPSCLLWMHLVEGYRHQLSSGVAAAVLDDPLHPFTVGGRLRLPRKRKD